MADNNFSPDSPVAHDPTNAEEENRVLYLGVQDDTGSRYGYFSVDNKVWLVGPSGREGIEERVFPLEKGPKPKKIRKYMEDNQLEMANHGDVVPSLDSLKKACPDFHLRGVVDQIEDMESNKWEIKKLIDNKRFSDADALAKLCSFEITYNPKRNEFLILPKDK